jgi:hypothetical protein
MGEATKVVIVNAVVFWLRRIHHAGFPGTDRFLDLGRQAVGYSVSKTSTPPRIEPASTILTTLPSNALWYL